MLGNALRLIRVFHDMKSNDLAEELGISPAYLSKIESEKIEPSMDVLKKYAKVFDVPVSSLLFFSDKLDEEKSRGPVKKRIRNTMYIFLKIVGGLKKDDSESI